jgi:chromate transport protein ChrA
MLINRFIKDKEKAKKVAHIAAGFVILIHAYEKYESGHGSYLFFAIFGIIFLAIAFFHHKIAQKFAWVDGVFFSIEAILSIIVAYEFFHMGKKALPITYLLLSFFQFFMAYKMGKKGLGKNVSNH